MRVLLILSLLAAAACTCHSDSDCPLEEICSNGRCVAVGGGGGTGHLLLAPASATVHGSAGEPSSASFELRNDGTAALSYNLSCSQGLPLPANGVLAVSATAPVSLPLPIYLAAGTHTVTCTATTPDGDGGPLTFTATLQVGPDVTPPTASVTAPAAGATVSGSVSLTASAADHVGVTSVDFAVDGAVVASASGTPFSASWSSSSTFNGPHTLTAIAHDAAGNAGASAGVAVSVANYPGAALSVHTTLGLPDAATTDPANKDHFLSVKHQYALSYSGTRRGPNWVSWELNTGWTGTIARQNDFRADDTFPNGFPQAQLPDYVSSGYDRGHMCPSDDRTLVLLDNQNTFYLTNMLPQLHTLNAGPWEKLEAYSRTLTAAGKELFVVAGGIYPGTPATIGTDAVAVPSSTWKVVVVLDHTGLGAQSVTTSTRVISVIMPNDSSVTLTTDWKGFRVKAADIEAQTGLQLMSDVSEPARAALEQQVDAVP
jgi:endonuclease G, mitochondrial